MPLPSSLRRRGGLLRLIRMIPFGATAAGAAALPLPPLRSTASVHASARARARTLPIGP